MKTELHSYIESVITKGYKHEPCLLSWFMVKEYANDVARLLRISEDNLSEVDRQRALHVLEHDIDAYYFFERLLE